MSYTIEYNRKIFYWYDTRSGERNYLLLVREGENNDRDAYTGLRSKDWHIIAQGWEPLLWTKIGERAGYTEGGMLQKAKGFESEYISIEDYIAVYRKAIKNAKPIEQNFDSFSKIDVYIEREKDIISEYESKVINEALRKYKFQYFGRDHYYKNVRRYFLSITNPKDLLYFLRLPRGEWGSDLHVSFSFNR